MNLKYLKWTLKCLSLCAVIIGIDLFKAGAEERISLRVRPFALMTSTFGFEGFLTNESGFFIGSTLHRFSGENADRQTALKTTEIGIKFGKLFQNTHPDQGWFLMGNVNYNLSTFDRFYSPTGERFSANLNHFSESLFAGYQWNTFLFRNHIDLRLGLGLSYLGVVSETFHTQNDRNLTLGLTNEFDPTLEITLGYTF